MHISQTATLFCFLACSVAVPCGIRDLQCKTMLENRQWATNLLEKTASMREPRPPIWRPIPSTLIRQMYEALQRQIRMMSLRRGPILAQTTIFSQWMAPSIFYRFQDLAWVTSPAFEDRDRARSTTLRLSGEPTIRALLNLSEEVIRKVLQRLQAAPSVRRTVSAMGNEPDVLDSLSSVTLSIRGKLLRTRRRPD